MTSYRKQKMREDAKEDLGVAWDSAKTAVGATAKTAWNISKAATKGIASTMMNHGGGGNITIERGELKTRIK